MLFSLSLLLPFLPHCWLTTTLSLSWNLHHCFGTFPSLSRLPPPPNPHAHDLLLLCAPTPCLPLCWHPSRTSSRLALDDAIRHRQLNISRFSPRVAGENDFLQTVINKVIAAKEVNHKGQGTESRGGNVLVFPISACPSLSLCHVHVCPPFHSDCPTPRKLLSSATLSCLDLNPRLPTAHPGHGHQR